jgi:hypothetical protein
MINTIEKIYNKRTNEFSSYKVTYDNSKISFVPHDTANRHYQAIQEWIAEGNTVIDNGGNS